MANGKKDPKKIKHGAILAAIVIVSLIVIWNVFYIAVGVMVPAVIGVSIVVSIVSIAAIIGIIISLNQRIKEIDEGEEDEASKY